MNSAIEIMVSESAESMRQGPTTNCALNRNCLLTAVITMLTCVPAGIGSQTIATDLSNLSPRLVRNSDPIEKQFWFSAPYVLAVTVTDRKLIGAKRSFEDTTIQLIQYAARVDTVLRGASVGKSISFVFFALTDPGPRYTLGPAQSYIVFLRNENGTLRTMSDGRDTSYEVFSGRHTTDEIPDIDVPEKIAYVLLTPGPDADLDLLSSTLGLNAAHSDTASPKYVWTLLTRLQKSPYRPLRDRACMAIMQEFWFHPDCLPSIKDSRDPSIRAKMDIMQKDPEDERTIAKQLKDAPQSFFGAERVDEKYVERVELFTFDTRALVRQAACDELKLLSPEKRFPSCRTQ
jgi:hypothetical protein